MPFQIIQSEEISCRYDFSILANARGWKDAVEVGVDQGVFAAQFMSRFQGHWLWLVDRWTECAGFPYDRTGDLFTAAVAMAPYHGRYRFVRMSSALASVHAAEHIKPDLVYIDGAHDEESVTSDLLAWWPVVSERGCLAGHDWDDGHPGVIEAVTRFAEERELVVRLTSEKDQPASWYAYKHEPAVLFRRFFDQGEIANPYAG